MASSLDPNVESIKQLTTQLNIARNEINNLRQQIKVLTHVNRKDYEAVQQKLQDWKCSACSNEQNTNGPLLQSTSSDLPLNYIGKIHTQFPEKRATPRQTGICTQLQAKLTLNNSVLTNPEHALQGLEEFSHMWVIFHFHQNESTHVRAKVAPPRLNGRRTGVFATRSPHRPCPIGLSLVKIDRIVDNAIYFSGVDMIDQTPVLDIKPYIPQYDSPSMNAQAQVVLDNSGLSDYLLDDETSVSDISEGIDNLNVRIMDGEEFGNDSTLLQERATTHTDLEAMHGRASRIGEREAPDGEENEEAQRPITTSRSSENIVRIPTWIDDQHTHQLAVYFKDSAIQQLIQFGEAEADEKLQTINTVLKEDPRSVYLRHRLGTNCYVFRIAMLYVFCKFNDVERSVTVFKVSQSAEDV